MGLFLDKYIIKPHDSVKNLLEKLPEGFEEYQGQLEAFSEDFSENDLAASLSVVSGEVVFRVVIGDSDAMILFLHDGSKKLIFFAGDEDYAEGMEISSPNEAGPYLAENVDVNTLSSLLSKEYLFYEECAEDVLPLFGIQLHLEHESSVFLNVPKSDDSPVSADEEQSGFMITSWRSIITPSSLQFPLPFELSVRNSSFTFSKLSVFLAAKELQNEHFRFEKMMMACCSNLSVHFYADGEKTTLKIDGKVFPALRFTFYHEQGGMFGADKFLLDSKYNTDQPHDFAILVVVCPDDDFSMAKSQFIRATDTPRDGRSPLHTEERLEELIHNFYGE